MCFSLLTIIISTFVRVDWISTVQYVWTRAGLERRRGLSLGPQGNWASEGRVQEELQVFHDQSRLLPYQLVLTDVACIQLVGVAYNQCGPLDFLGSFSAEWIRDCLRSLYSWGVGNHQQIWQLQRQLKLTQETETPGTSRIPSSVATSVLWRERNRRRCFIVLRKWREKQNWGQHKPRLVPARRSSHGACAEARRNYIKSDVGCVEEN